MRIDDFHYKGAMWRKITHSAERKFSVGLDLGQSHDPTALAVVEYHRTPVDEFTVDNDRKTMRQIYKEHFDVVHLERLPLGTNYVDVAHYVAAIMDRSPLKESGAELLADATGVGRAATDIMRRSGLRFTSVVITGGDVATYVSRDEWRVPKSVLITGLDARLSVGELRFSDKLKEAATIRRELEDFRRTIGATGHVTFNARSGAHDDLLLAVSLPIWALGSRKSRGDVSTGFVRGLF